MAQNLLNKKPVMGWSECRVFVAEATGADFPAKLDELGEILEKSCVLNSEQEQDKVIRKTGGAVVASEPGAVTYSLELSVIAPNDALLAFIGVGKTSADGVAFSGSGISKSIALQVVPKNVNATGIKAGNTSVSATYTRDEEQGDILKLKFTFAQDSKGAAFTRYKHTGTVPAATV